MRVATGLLMAIWLIFMGFKFFTIEPVGTNGEAIRSLSLILLIIQLIGWAFVFTKPIVTFTILLSLLVFSLLIAVTFESSYFIFVVVDGIFAIMSYSGHRELVKKTKVKKVKTV
ncbi:hypothetical protein D3C81_1762060 [compost metagenome]